MYNKIKILPAGNFIKINENNLNKISFKKFWDFNFVEDKNLNENYCQEKLKYLLEKSITKQIRSDVEIGTYLSGGIDSGILNLIASKKLKILNLLLVVLI